MSELALQLIAENKLTKNPKLDLGRTGLVELPEELFDCTWLEELILCNDYWDTEKGKSIESNSNGPINDFKFIDEKISSLKKMRILRLTKLSLSSKQISDFIFLRELINLQTLSLGYNNISEYRFLDNLINLQSLDLGFNKISEGIFLVQHLGLQSLNLSHNQIMDYKFLGQLINLQSLDLSSNHISSIRFIEGCNGLQTLNLSNNQISDTRFLENLFSLQSLDLSYNRLSNSRFLEKLTNLKSLNLSFNQISDYNFINKLTELKSLDLGSNQISYARFLENGFINLQSLNLSNNKISDTHFIGNLTGLQSLNLSFNQITDYNFLDKLTNKLQSLNLSNNQISDTHFIGNLTGLQSLNLSTNSHIHISHLQNIINLQSLILQHSSISSADFIENLTNLELLDVSFNSIYRLDFLHKLTKLESLYIRNNRISDITYIERLTSLKFLDLRNNYISNISILKKLPNLHLLNLSYNKISDIHSLESLTSLQSLSLSSNQINDPISIKNITSLEQLDVSKNQIENISSLLPFLQRSRNPLKIVFNEEWQLVNGEINLIGNPLIKPPIEIVKLGNKAVLDYYKELEKQGGEYLYEAKMLIVGQPRAGKTSLRIKLFNRNEELPSEDKTTRGIDIHQLDFIILDKEQNKRKFKYNIWDFGGQLIYKTTHQFFLTCRSLYVLVIDTGKDSISDDNSDINYWLQAVEVLGGRSPLLLVRNEKNGRQINIDLQQKKARFNFFKTDHSIDLNALIPDTAFYKENRVTSFIRLKEDMEAELSKLPLVGFPMPRNWVRIREELQKLSETCPYISRQDYINLCNQFDVTEFEKQMELSRIFHDLGVFLHFQDYGTLDEFIILQNTWATDAVFAVLDNPEVQAAKGKFTDSELSAIWRAKDYESKVHKKLLALMMQFELCYQVDKGKESLYIVPEMLDESAPEKYEWMPNNDLPLQYRYDFMPRGILTRLIVRLHKHIEIQSSQQSVWKTGVKISGASLDCLNTFVEITEAWNNKQLTLRVQGAFCKDLMSKITYEIDLLNSEFFRSTDGNESIQKSKWHKMIPCNCEICLNNTDKHFYDYITLLKAREKNRDIQCQKSFDDVKVNELLDGVFSKKSIIKPVTIKKDVMNPPQIFISYSHLDEKSWKDEMVKHLSALKNQELISAWTDRQIEAGLWNEQIEEAMENTDIFLLLITHNFLASSYITSKEITKAYEMYKAGQAKIFPVICDSCKWQLQPITKTEKEMHPTLNREMNIWLGKFQPFPKDGIPIQNWPNKQDGFVDVIDQLMNYL